MSQSKPLLAPNSLTINTIKIHTGCPHFKGEIRKYQQADYNIFKALYEFIDNVIPKEQTQNIYLDFKFDGNQIISIVIRDDYYPGFENIREEGTGNPFNLSHMRLGQDDDAEISQFGVGMKAGAISLANCMEIYTRVGNLYYHVEMNFLEMSEREDAIDSYNPNIRIVDFKEYKSKHGLCHGSSIYLTNIRTAMYYQYDKRFLMELLRKKITKTYSELLKIKPVNLFLNEEKIEPLPCFFEEPECSIFNRVVKIYKLKNGSLEVIYGYFPYLEKDNYKIVNNKTGCLKKISYTDIQGLYLNNNYKYVDTFTEENKYCMLLECTFTMYNPKMRTKKGAQIYMPRNRIMVYRDGRLYGEWSKEKSNDGNHNFNDTRVILSSKRILTELGLTFNKHMSQHVVNNTYNALWKLFLEIRKGFNANTSTLDNERLYVKAIENNIEVADGSQKEENGVLVQQEERRPISYRPKKTPVPIPSPPVVTSTQEDTIRFIYTMIQDFKDHTLDDFNLMEAKLVEEKQDIREGIFKIQSILTKFNLKK